MVDETDDELGPIDYAVVEFPPGTARLTGAMAQELASLVDTEIIRVLDLVLVHKDADGSLEVMEFEDLDDVGDLGLLEGRLAEVLAAEDVEHLAAAMEPGSSGVALGLGEHLGRAVRRRGARVRAGNSWPAAASPPRRCSPPSAPTRKERDMPIRPGRIGRPGVIGRPVARTAAVVGSAAVVAHGVDRRSDRREDRRDRRF